MEANGKKEIQIVIDKYAECYLNKDLNKLMSLFASDHDIIAIGSGKADWIKGHDKLKNSFKRDFSQADNIRLLFDNITITVLDKVAWVSSSITMYALINKVDVVLSGRISMVLKKENENWLFTHMHYSLPAEKPGKRIPWNEYY